jgi:hypothetical protein
MNHGQPLEPKIYRKLYGGGLIGAHLVFFVIALLGWMAAILVWLLSAT